MPKAGSQGIRDTQGSFLELVLGEDYTFAKKWAGFLGKQSYLRSHAPPLKGSRWEESLAFRDPSGLKTFRLKALQGGSCVDHPVYLNQATGLGYRRGSAHIAYG